MDHDVAKGVKPGASQASEDTHEGIGKATRAQDEGALGGSHVPRMQLGRVGGEIGGPSGAAPAAPAAAPAAAGPAKNTALTITSSTSAKAPAGANTRTTVGVGEQVTFTGSEEGDWTTTGGKTLSDTKTTEFRWMAPGAPGSYTITLKVGDKKTSKTIVVVAPSAIYFHKAGQGGPGSGQGVSMKLNMDIGPKNVSFGAVQVKEKPGGASNVWGYFAKQQKGGADLSHKPRVSWTYVNEDNTLDSPDDAYFDGWSAPFEPGGLTWVIPNLWSLVEEGGDGKPFASVTQNMNITDKKGTSVIMKGGQTASRNGSS